MKRKLLFLIILSIICGGIFFIIRYVVFSGPKQGMLKIHSTPNTSIFLDDKHVGRTPYEDSIVQGEYTVKLVPETGVESVSSWQGKVKIAPNVLTYVNAELGTSEFVSSVDILWLEKTTSKQTELTVLTNPDGATVSLDGQEKGTSPLSLSDISVGDHTIGVNSAGFSPRTLKVKTTAGYKLITTMKLALASSDINAIPSESSQTSELAQVQETLTPTAPSKTTPIPTPRGPTPTDLDKPYVVIEDTPTGFLRVRVEPGTTASEAGRVNPGQKFSLLDTKTDSKNTPWYQIMYEDAKKGWISSQYAEKFE